MNAATAHNDTRRAIFGWSAVVVVVMTVAPVSGRTANPTAGPRDGTPNRTPHELQGAGLENTLGQSVDLELEFKDSTGKTVKIGDYFTGDRPVLLNMVYFECPMLCTMALTGTLDTLKEVEWTAGGEQFTVVTISFNPEEGPELAAAKKANYLEAYDRPGAEKGWAFLTGSATNTRALADSLGFRYEWVESENQYSHAAALYVLTPDGKISQAIGGIMYDPQAVRLSLVEASGGKIGTIGDMLQMFCGRYDPETGKYQYVAMQLMKLGAAATIVVLGVVLMSLWWWDRYKRQPRVIAN